MGGKRVKKGSKATVPDREGAVAPVLSLAAVFPRLDWEVHSRVLGDNRTPRRPSALSIFHQDGQVKACLKDRTQGLVAFVSAATLWECLWKLEENLIALTLDWRKDKFWSDLPPVLASKP